MGDARTARRVAAPRLSAARLGAVGLCAVTVLGLAGCGSGGTTTPPAAAPTSVAGPTVASPTVAGPTVAGPTTSAPAGHGAHSGTTGGPTDTAPEVPPGIVQGNLGFIDQVSDGRHLIGSAEIDGAPGWVVVRTDQGGRPGAVLGRVHRDNGVHDDVATVTWARKVRSGPVWVSLHIDEGTVGRFEFPGPDRPLTFAGADLRHRLVLAVR